MSSLGQTAFSPCRGDDAVLYGGFLGAAYLAPHDLSTHGLPQEMDPDDDGDGLPDWDEVTGTAFLGFAVTDPDRADTDGDGMDDYKEALLLFDPNDPLHALCFVAVTNTPSGLNLVWTTRGGGTTNDVWWSSSLGAGAFSNLYDSIVVFGGLPPWHKRTVVIPLPVSSTSNRFFRISITSSRSLTP